MRFTYSVHVLCSCGLGQKCPRLWRRDGSWNSRHGSAGYACRVPTSAGVKAVKRYGYPSKTAAETAAKAVGELLDLAGADDTTRNRIGDMIVKVRRGAPLPARADVARRLGLGQDPASPGVTFGQAWREWLTGNRRLRLSSRRRLEGIAEHWLLPVLEEVPLERLNGAHCVEVFDRIERINAEITSQQAAGQTVTRPEGDVRERPKVVGTASQHRIFAALRTVLNFEVKVTHRLVFNPVYAVRLEPEVTPEAQRWSAGEVKRFLEASASDPLGLLFRIMVLRGQRHGEIIGARWADVDWEAGTITVTETVLQLGGTVVMGEDTKTRKKRFIFLDAATLDLLRAHRKAQLAARMRAGAAWQDHDLIFCRDDGSPWPPDYVSRRLKAIASEASLPVIKLHEAGRHTASSLGHDAKVDPEIRRRTLGHADQAMTSHYTHPEAAAYRQAAEDVAAYVEKA